MYFPPQMKVDTTKNDIRKIVADLPMDKEMSQVETHTITYLHIFLNNF